MKPAAQKMDKNWAIAVFVHGVNDLEELSSLQNAVGLPIETWSLFGSHRCDKWGHEVIEAWELLQ